MKTIFIFWMFITLILCLSIIGWILLLPKPNNTEYFKSVSETRSTWMSLGYDIFNKIK